MKKGCSARFLPDLGAALRYQGMKRIAGRQWVGRRRVHHQMLQRMLSQDLRDQMWADLPGVDISASLLGHAPKLQSQMMRARKFKDRATHAAPRLVFESKNDV